MTTPFIIADIGSNHRNNYDIALQQIQGVKEAGCDAAKFQLYTHKDLYGYEGKLDYELPREWIPELARACKALDIEFMCSAFSEAGFEFVNPYVETHKVASSENKHPGILGYVKDLGKPWMVSLGGSHYEEIDWLIDTYSPTCVMECIAKYPASEEDYAQATFDYDVPKLGLSDHTLTSAIALKALSHGVSVFEKHFDAFLTNEDFPTHSDTPDSCVSIGFKDMKQYVKDIQSQAYRGDGRRPGRSEDDMLLQWKKRIVATRDLEVGDRLELGVNYGAYRTKMPDYQGDDARKLYEYDGKYIKTPVKQGYGINFKYVNDLL